MTLANSTRHNESRQMLLLKHLFMLLYTFASHEKVPTANKNKQLKLLVPLNSQVASTYIRITRH